MKHATAAELAALSRLFSPAVIREISRTGKSSLLARLLRQTALPMRLAPDATLAEAFEEAFRILRQLGNRDDYVYRQAITQKIVLGRHNLRTATVLNEVRAVESKADVVVLNGTSTAYEIKSERDSTRRLLGQLADYRRVFASVSVVTSPMQRDSILGLVPEDVGVIVLSDRYTLSAVRDAAVSPERVQPEAILATLRAEEAGAVLRELGRAIPEVPNTLRFGEHLKVFRLLDPVETHASMEPFLKRLPEPLGSAILAGDLSAQATETLRDATLRPLADALAW